MIRRLLLFLAALVAAIWWMRRSRRKPAAGSAARRSVPEDAAADPMVRDRVCNTFLPRSRAITAGSGENELFFCSEACREKHFASQKGR